VATVSVGFPSSFAPMANASNRSAIPSARSRERYAVSGDKSLGYNLKAVILEIEIADTLLKFSLNTLG
jgi:hypothetical protein